MTLPFKPYYPIHEVIQSILPTIEPTDLKMSNEALFRKVADKLCKYIEAGVEPWKPSWKGANLPAISIPKNWDGKPYKGMNILLLWCAAAEHQFKSQRYFTFKKVNELGGHIIKGEHGFDIVFADKMTKTRMNDFDEEERISYWFWKSYKVFNGDQCANLPEAYRDIVQPVTEPQDVRIERLERYFSNCGVPIVNHGNKAFYSPTFDRITMPPIHAFDDPESYYATLAHEEIHATGHASRLNRVFGKRFADAKYKGEEIVAEVGSAILCAAQEITADVRRDHADYCVSWEPALKENPQAIFVYASKAQQAVDWCEKKQQNCPKDAFPLKVA